MENRSPNNGQENCQNMTRHEIEHTIAIVTGAINGNGANSNSKKARIPTKKKQAKFRLLDTDHDQGTDGTVNQVVDLRQKCIDDMNTSELIHLITNGVQSILLHSTNEDFRRTNFARLKVRNTEDAAVVFRNQFLKLCGLSMDTSPSPEHNKLLQEEKENMPCETSYNPNTHFSPQYSGNSIFYSEPFNASNPGSQLSQGFMGFTNNQSGLESPNMHLSTSYHSLSPSLLENEDGINNEVSSIFSHHMTERVPASAANDVPYLDEDGIGNVSPSLLENVESSFGIPLEGESQSNLSEIEDEDRLLKWLDREKTYSQHSYYQRSPEFRVQHNQDTDQSPSHTSKRQKALKSTGPNPKLSKTELQQALASKLEVLKSQKLNSQSQS